jgi:uncharacterized protein (TIGR01777 family)
MRCLVTGGTGFIGRHLIRELERPVVLGRSIERINQLPGKVTACRWDPGEQIPARVFAGVDTVIHLAGESVYRGRWNQAKKQRINESRVGGTRSIVRAMSELDRPPHTLISGSAIGYYGSRGNEILTESSSPGSDFLARVCMAWEDEAKRAEDAGIRVVCLRTGVVLGRGGGALAQMLRPFRLGLGGRLGSGHQYMSWIHIDDLIGILLHAARNETLHGPLNGVSPTPVTNREFTRTLAGILHRPAVFPVPVPVLRAVLGDFATVLTASQRVMPEKAARSGYGFSFSNLSHALADLT